MTVRLLLAGAAGFLLPALFFTLRAIGLPRLDALLRRVQPDSQFSFS